MVECVDGSLVHGGLFHICIFIVTVQNTGTNFLFLLGPFASRAALLVCCQDKALIYLCAFAKSRLICQTVKDGASFTASRTFHGRDWLKHVFLKTLDWQSFPVALEEPLHSHLTVISVCIWIILNCL